MTLDLYQFNCEVEGVELQCKLEYEPAEENYKAEVIAYTADLGQEIDRKKIIKNAKNLGVKNICIHNFYF